MRMLGTESFALTHVWKALTCGLMTGLKSVCMEFNRLQAECNPD